MYSREEVKAITDKVINMAKADAVEVEFSGGERSATRFANSNITANMVQYDRNVSVTIYVGTKSATASTRDFDDASLKTAVDDAQKRAQEARENPEALPLIEGPQDYVQVDAALASGVNFGPAERARMVKQSLDVCQKKGVIGSGYIPKSPPDDVHGELEGPVRLLPVRRGELHPDLSHERRRRLRVGGTTGIKDVSLINADRADGGRLGQGAQEPEAPGDRAGALHDHPRASRQRALPLADDRPLQRPGGGRPRGATTSAGSRRDTTKKPATSCSATPLRSRATSATPSCGRRRSVSTAWRRGPPRGSRRACSRRSSYDRLWAKRREARPQRASIRAS